jgi:hypothetical protein
MLLPKELTEGARDGGGALRELTPAEAENLVAEQLEPQVTGAILLKGRTWPGRRLAIEVDGWDGWCGRGGGCLSGGR